MKKILFLCTFFCTSALMAGTELEDAVDLLSWLEQHTKEFASCEPINEDGNYVLCDKTRVSKAELKKLFTLKPDKLISEMKSKGITVELLCATDSKTTPLGQKCVKESKNKMFSEISSLHGKYVPESKTIFIRNSTSPGSLVHEYIHFLQSGNKNAVYGKIYKKKRNEVQRDLNRLMEEKITLIQNLKNQGKDSEAKPHLQEFMIASDATRGFAPWQDLIDERGIFLLYLKYGNEFGATQEDLDLARKNMGFICKNPKLTKLIPENQCKM